MRLKAMLVLLTMVAAGAGHAEDLTTLVYFTDDTHMKLQVQFQIDGDFPAAGSECLNAIACLDLYWLEHRVGPRRDIPVNSVRLVQDALFPTLEFALAAAPASLDKLHVVLAGMKDKDAKPLEWVSLPIQPQIIQNEFGKGVTFTYQSIEPRKLEKINPKDITVTAVDKKDSNRQYTARVKGVTKITEDGPLSDLLHTVAIDEASLPRGKALKTTVSGLETFGSDAVPVKTSVTRMSFPEGREDARFYANGSIEADSVEHNRAYKFDVLIAPKFDLSDGLWQHGPKLDAIIGNKVSKAPNTLAASWDVRRFLVSRFSDSILSHDVSFSPTYRIDRNSKSRDAGIDAQYEPFVKRWADRTLEQRRADAESNPLALKWGWELLPTVGFETGIHLRSEDPAVDGSAFNRLRGKIVVMAEREVGSSLPGTVKLTVTGTVRQLFSDEAVLNDDGELVGTDRADKTFFRADLSYDIGPWALTLTHMNGRQPPAFSATHSTSFGVTVKY
jgi:hypothetical protein